MKVNEVHCCFRPHWLYCMDKNSFWISSPVFHRSIKVLRVLEIHEGEYMMTELPVCNYSPSCRSKPVRPLFIFGTQIKMFLIKSESSLTLHRQQHKRLNRWCHMDYLQMPLFLDLGTLQLCCGLWRVRELSDLIQNILICVPKMSKVFTGLEWHEGE